MTRSRREFLKFLGSGLAIAVVSPDLAGRPVRALAGPAQAGFGPDAEPPTDQIAAWLHVAGDNRVTVYTGKVEVGQGIRTSLAQEVAEELRVPTWTVQMIMGDTDLTPYDMGTFGSMSTPRMGAQLRKVAASARELFLDLAAQTWGVPRASLTASLGEVWDATRTHRATYGQLVGGRLLVEQVRDDAPLTPASGWKIAAGRSVARVGASDVVTGRPHYPTDQRLPDMLYGKVLRPPSIGATLSNMDGSGASGVKDAVVVADGDFVGVAAPRTADAERALLALRATWTPAPDPQPDAHSVYDYLRRTRPSAEGRGGGEGGGRGGPTVKGDVEAALATAPHRLDRTYTVAYIAHVPLEPRAALAEWTTDAKGEKLTVWTGTQRPFAVKEELMRAFGLPGDRVRVIMPDTGSAYGGKHTGECAVEAARLARGAKKPVKLVWTREEEFRWAYFRPAGVIDVGAGMTADGKLTAWKFDNYNSGPAAIDPWYDIPNQRVEYHPSESPLRQGSYRGLAATANHFAREMHVDEMAHLIEADPLEFRLRNIADDRLRHVFLTAADRFGWGKPRAPGHGVGIAGGFEKGGYIATAIEVAVDTAAGSVKLVRGVSAFDCGAVVNPDILRNQIEGAFVQGIGGALFEAIDFDHGVIRNAHLAQYRVPRFSDVPELDVVLVDRKDLPSMGAGETPIFGVAPAIGAAIFDAGGVRLRALPMARGGLGAG
ncbi:MAG: molybdopterin-dependent oxidoreductase [Gemmatimonadota bacterium]|nr:molybdopterin-dependent oxidoreductase [Gemmatimonadota bacterium]